MAIYGGSIKFLTMLGMDLVTKPASLTLAEYLEVGPAYPGLTIVNYLISKGVPESLTFRALTTSAAYFGIIDDAMHTVGIINFNNEYEDAVFKWGRDSEAFIPQHGLAIEPQNGYMSYKPSNQTISDFYDYNGSINLPPLTYTDSNGNIHFIRLENTLTILGDETIIIEGYDIVDNWYWLVAMRRSAHNPQNLEFVDAVPYTTQFDNVGYDYTIKNGLNSVTFFTTNYNPISNTEAFTTTLTIGRKNKLSITDNYKLINPNGIVSVYNELTNSTYNEIQYQSYNPRPTSNDFFDEMMAGSKMGTYYFMITGLSNDGGATYTPVEKYENIVAINFLTGKYEFIDAKQKLQEVVTFGNFPNAWGNLIDAFYDTDMNAATPHPEGLLFTLGDGNSPNNVNLNGVTRLWSAEWSNYLNPVPVTTRYLDNQHGSNMGTYSSYYGNINYNVVGGTSYSGYYLDLSPKYLFTYFNLTQEGTTSAFPSLPNNSNFQKFGHVDNQIYRFELNPKNYNQEPDLQSIPRYTPDFKKIVRTDSGSAYPNLQRYSYTSGGDSISTTSGYYINYNYEKALSQPTNNGMLFGYHNIVTFPFYFDQPYGELNINYWADNSNKPIPLGSNLGVVNFHNNNTLYGTTASIYRMVYTFNTDKYKGLKFN